MLLSGTFIVLFVWWGGALLRVYRQARFYQIEEYKSDRYGRWWWRQRGRMLPPRALGATLVGAALAVILGEAPGSPVPVILASLAALVAVWPPDEGEIKKPFRRTPRATRLLAMAFALVTLLTLAGMLFLPAEGDLAAPLAMLWGLLIFLLAPPWLMLANGLMTPLEAAFRRRFINRARRTLERLQPRTIGLTGSYGKTTTKNFLRDILDGRFKTYATPKSYNTLMGVCLAINQDLADDYSIETFVCEMGMYVPGEIASICELVRPDVGIVIEVGPVHLERAGSMEAIARAKYEIIEGTRPEGLGVFNWDNPYVREMYERGYPAQRVAVSTQADPDEVPDDGPRFIASDIHETLDGLRFTVTDRQTTQRETFTTAVIGQHNVLNILLATAVAVHEGMNLREIGRRVRQLQPAESRLVREVKAGITIINDAYSANPVGVVSALRVLKLHAQHENGRRLLVTPGMVELGERQDAENRQLGQRAAEAATDVILVGERQTAPIREGLLAANFPEERLLTVATLAEAVTWYQQHLQAGDVVLFLNDLPDTY